MKQVVWIALLFCGVSIAPAEGDEIQSCRDMLHACQQWCYANRRGPEMFLCKRNCQTEFSSSLSSGAFRWQDGAVVPCEPVPGVVSRGGPKHLAANAGFNSPSLADLH